LNARCTQSGPPGLQSRPKGEQFSSRILSLHPWTSRPVDPIPPRNMQRSRLASAAVLFRWKECVPECNRFSPFCIDISSMSVITRETDSPKSGTGISLIFCLSHPQFSYFQVENFHQTFS
jgi:hypothetical protein